MIKSSCSSSCFYLLSFATYLHSFYTSVLFLPHVPSATSLSPIHSFYVYLCLRPSLIHLSLFEVPSSLGVPRLQIFHDINFELELRILRSSITLHTHQKFFVSLRLTMVERPTMDYSSQNADDSSQNARNANDNGPQNMDENSPQTRTTTATQYRRLQPQFCVHRT